MRLLRDALLVAGFDLGDSLRSRRVLALLVIYVAGAVASAAGFVAILHDIEGTLASELGVAATSRPGALTEALMASDQLHQILADLTGDASLVDSLVRVPLLALLYGWSALMFTPALVTFTACDAVAADVATGACRFSLARTTRLSWALGKLGGQAALMATGILGGAIGTWIVGAISLDGFPWLDTAIWLSRLGFRAWWNGLPYLGLALAASLVTRSTSGARALALLLLVGVGSLDTGFTIPRLHDLWPVGFDTLRQLLPGAHTGELWRPDLLDRMPSLVMQAALTGAWFLSGYAIFARRDA